jgi:hypothetical protein
MENICFEINKMSRKAIFDKKWKVSKAFCNIAVMRFHNFLVIYKFSESEANLFLEYNIEFIVRRQHRLIWRCFLRKMIGFLWRFFCTRKKWRFQDRCTKNAVSFLCKALFSIFLAMRDMLLLPSNLELKQSRINVILLNIVKSKSLSKLGHYRK